MSFLLVYAANIQSGQINLGSKPRLIDPVSSAFVDCQESLTLVPTEVDMIVVMCCVCFEYLRAV